MASCNCKGGTERAPAGCCVGDIPGTGVPGIIGVPGISGRIMAGGRRRRTEGAGEGGGMRESSVMRREVRSSGTGPIEGDWPGKRTERGGKSREW